MIIILKHHSLFQHHIYDSWRQFMDQIQRSPFPSSLHRSKIRALRVNDFQVLHWTKKFPISPRSLATVLLAVTLLEGRSSRRKSTGLMCRPLTFRKFFDWSQLPRSADMKIYKKHREEKNLNYLRMVIPLAFVYLSVTSSRFKIPSENNLNSNLVLPSTRYRI